MPSANGKGKARQNGAATALAAAPVCLDSDELTGLRNRFETWQAQRVRSRNEQLLEQMAQESYTRCVRDIQAKYGLPPRYVVDFETGAVTLAETEASDG